MKSPELLKSSNYWLCLSLTGLLLAMTPLIARAATFRVSVIDDLFTPNGVDNGETFTISVGDTVIWKLKSSNSHNLDGGDYEGHTCSEEGLIHTFLGMGDKYSHTFTMPGPCYYKCPMHTGMQGLINVKAVEGAPPAAPEEK